MKRPQKIKENLHCKLQYNFYLYAVFESAGFWRISPILHDYNTKVKKEKICAKRGICPANKE